MWHQNTGVSLVIRTDFAHPQEWARIQRTAIEPQTEEGFDTETLTHPDQPILVVNLYDYAEGPEDQGKGPQYDATFRVVPSELWSVQNNLSISNMDWKDFAGNVDGDGILRGFE